MKLLNTTTAGCRTRPLVIDAAWSDKAENMPAVIFCHGYKGFKDWGAWNLVAKSFAEAGFLFVKFNFSHNGGTVDEPIDFPDLDAFAENNFSMELEDLQLMLDWVDNSSELPRSHMSQDRFVLGHSRGGGIALIETAGNNKITAAGAWAAVSDFGSRFPKGEALENWKTTGLLYSANARTKQQMPHLYQWFANYQENQSKFDIPSKCKEIVQPVLVVHGEDDAAVTMAEAHNLATWIQNSQLQILPSTGHTFDAAQPWQESTMPVALQKAVDLTIAFFKQNRTS
jgi:pimeloyl-ACP methyl ester carboxylesterase